jgi:Xaa-Pro aminopeptidase
MTLVRAPRFSPQEMSRRWTLARELMRRHDIGALVIFGSSGVNRHNQANIFWLTNYLDLHHTYLVVSQDPSVEPMLFVGLQNHVPDAQDISEVPVAWGGYDPAASVAAHLLTIGAASARIGLVGVNATFGFSMPYRHYQSLQSALPDLERMDITAQFAALREVKSDEEVGWLRHAASFTDLAVQALVAGARPGMPEYALPAIIEGAYRPAGGLPHITFVRSMAMDNPTGCVPAQNPSTRILAQGDVILTEISASYWGYSGQIHRPVFVGADPTPPWRRLFDTAYDAYQQMAAVLRPGVGEREVIRAASIIGERGYGIYDDLIHGYGVDIHPPVVDRTCCAYWPWNEARPAPAGRQVQRNMAIVIQPNPITLDDRAGVQLGALTVVTDDGALSLHQVPFEPLIAKG